MPSFLITTSVIRAKKCTSYSQTDTYYNYACTCMCLTCTHSQSRRAVVHRIVKEASLAEIGED